MIEMKQRLDELNKLLNPQATVSIERQQALDITTERIALKKFDLLND